MPDYYFNYFTSPEDDLLEDDTRYASITDDQGYLYEGTGNGGSGTEGTGAPLSWFSKLDKLDNTSKGLLTSFGLGLDYGSQALRDLITGGITDSRLTGRMISNAIGNSLMATFPTAGVVYKVGLLGYDALNLALSKKTDNFSINKDAALRVGSGFNGSIHDLYKALSQSNTTFGGFTSKAYKRAQLAIAKANATNQKIVGIDSRVQDWTDMDLNIDFINKQKRLEAAGGFDQRYQSAKQGAKLTLTEEWTPTLEDPWQPTITEVPYTIKYFKSGGSVQKEKNFDTGTLQKNVIPEGALHKNKHHLKDTGFDDKHITKKGIPVIDTDGKQLAEIELNEIIFTLEVTKKLEDWYNTYYDVNSSNKNKEEVALQAGKLLWKEIIYNTDDRTGLIDTLKIGGIIKEE